MDEEDRTDRVARRGRIVFIGFLLVAGFYLVTEHTAHFLGALPFLIFLACPLMHFFMHGHHGGYAHDPKQGSSEPSSIIVPSGPVEGGLQ